MASQVSGPSQTNRHYLVYCDESRHDPHQRNAFMGIGGLWLPWPAKDALRDELHRTALAHGLRGEIKWSKVSAQCLEGYRAFVDVFLRHAELRFRVILVDQRHLDLDAFHDGDRELGFYKFYYQMLIKWLHRDAQYVILLDHQVSQQAGRHTKLREVLGKSLGAPSAIRQLTVSDSRASRLAQLCDLLTGAVVAAWCETPPTSPKGRLQAHIASGLGLASLRTPSPGPAFGKCNIFKIRLQTPSDRRE